MSKILYVAKNFNKSTLELIEIANQIIEDYQSRGYNLTLRQLYYQLVARDLIPNTEKSYKKLGNTISNARDAGMVDWLAIVDRTRSSNRLQVWSNPKEILGAALASFRLDKWNNQKHRVSVWVEKEALIGVIARACNDEDIQVEYLSCRGYMSASTIWREGLKLRKQVRNGYTPVIIHLGDHDPSGIDMTRDNTERLALYSDYGTESFIFRRIALNWNQVEEYSPPPNPTKLTDTRANNYIDEYGYESWELDALDPDVLVSLITDTINEYKDAELWAQSEELEEAEREKLQSVIEDWENE